jgi:hypothetical protein
MSRLQPSEGQWYTLRDNGQMIFVINVDADHEVIDIQDFDGDIDELGFDEWRELDLELASAPEDSSVVNDAEEGNNFGDQDVEPGPHEGEEYRVRMMSGSPWPRE